MQSFTATIKFAFVILCVIPFTNSKGGVCSGPYIELQVSPVVADGYIRRLTMQWERLPSGSEIGVFNDDPTKGTVKAVFTHKPTTLSGWANTTIMEKHVPYTELGFQSRCLNHYVAYRTDKKWLGVSCLKTEPNWMWDLKAKISETPLKKLFIPGTHDSAAYKEFDPKKPEDRITKHSVTQSEPFLAQLIYGSRYFDLRVGYYPLTKEIWWGNHAVYQFHPMSELLGNITKFLENTKDFIIFDIQGWPIGFGQDYKVHRLFLQYINETIGKYAVPKLDKMWGSTVGDIFKSGKRIIIGYDNSTLVSEYNFLWPAVEQVWGDKQRDVDLMAYLATAIKKPPNHAWAAMAQLTPTIPDIVLNTMKGLRHCTELVSHNITAAFRQASWAANTNVLAVNFLRGSGVVNNAIQWNSGAGPCQKGNKT